MWLPRNVIMLPTESELSGLTMYHNGKFDYCELSTNMDKLQYHTNQHLYIVSDEDIVLGDWFITRENVIYRYSEEDMPSRTWEFSNKGKINFKNNGGRKIIATTDIYLGWTNIFSDGEGHLLGCNSKVGIGSIYKPELPSISKTFIKFFCEKYNKKNRVEEVLVEYEKLGKYGNALLTCSPNNNESNSDMSIYKDYVKINPDNTITIKPDQKTWTREEVIKLCSKAWLKTPNDPNMLENFDNWIKENL